MRLIYTLTLYDVTNTVHLLWTLAPAGASGMAAWRGGLPLSDTQLTPAAFGTARSTIKLRLGAKEMVESIDVPSPFDIHRPR